MVKSWLENERIGKVAASMINVDVAALEPRPLYQTRHTFATLMLDAGEHPGWVQKMMDGHETMQMIYEKYYSYIKSYEKDEGSAFMERVYGPAAPAVPVVKEKQSKASLPLRF